MVLSNILILVSEQLLKVNQLMKTKIHNRFISSIILLSIVLLFSSATIHKKHPIHVSVCDIKHNEEKNWMEITIKIFADDFEDLLFEQSEIQTLLGSNEEHIKTNDLIVDYLSRTLSFSIDGKKVAYSFVGKEVEELAVWCYLYIPEVTDMKSFTITNRVMMDWFKDQTNVVHVDYKGKLKSTFFSNVRGHEETFEY